MGWKKVLDYMKEQEFGFDRTELCKTEISAALPDDFAVTEFVNETGDDGVAESVEVFIPPARSTATRKYPARTKGHARGSLVDPGSNRAITFASTREMRCAAILLASPHIAEVYDQPPAITYVGADGKVHTHTPDYLAVGRAGGTCYIAVKPSHAVESSGIEDVIKRAKLSIDVDDFILLTDDQLTRERAANAESVLHARTCRIQADCDRVRELICDVEGEINAYEIAQLFGSFPLGMNAIWCLIYDGFLRLSDTARLMSDHPFVRVNSSARLA